MKNGIEIKVLPHQFWDSQGVGIRGRLFAWQFAFVFSVPDWVIDIVSK